ncbi:MAG: transthyretin-like family protein [Clostridia bacterium]|nr:transthyretin-like family protein [Clostridia bacterium]
MTKRIAPIFIILLILCCALSACNTSADTPNTYGTTISGRIICGGQPLANVEVFHGDNQAYSNEYGIFVLSGLDKQDTVYFVLDGYIFNPDKIIVSNNIYDLEIVAIKTEKQPDENQDKPSGENEDKPTENPEEKEPDKPTEEEQEPDDDNEDEEITPNCTNGALIIQNSTIKFMFCVDNDFSALVFSTLNNDIETVISPQYSKEKDITINNKTYSLYSADITGFVGGNEIEFFVKASNENHTTGTVASAVYYPATIFEKPTLSIENNALKWTSLEEGTNYSVLINGIIVATTKDLSFDLQPLNLPSCFTAQIRAQYANGIVTYSNILDINIE